ncbi:hypothetical protein MMPV_001763 [Pyropia vietnamensis]
MATAAAPRAFGCTLLSRVWRHLPPPRVWASTTAAPPTTPTSRPRAPLIFDEAAKAAQKGAAAAAPDAATYDYLRDEVASRVVERLHDMARRFPRVLDYGCGGGHVLRALHREGVAGGGERKERDPPSGEHTAVPGGIEHLTMADVHPAVVDRARATAAVAAPRLGLTPEFAVSTPSDDADAVLSPAGDGANGGGGSGHPPYDAVLSSMALHWTNDLPGVLARLASLLRPDGLLIAALPGGRTLEELRISLQLAELEARSGAGARVSPFIAARDGGALLGRGGFGLTTVDVELLTVPYPDLATLVRHLWGAGEGAALVGGGGSRWAGRGVRARAEEIYWERFGVGGGGGGEGREALAPGEAPYLPVTVEVVYLTGWKFDTSQPVPKGRGTATVSMRDIPTSGAPAGGGAGAESRG